MLCAEVHSSFILFTIYDRKLPVLKIFDRTRNTVPFSFSIMLISSKIVLSRGVGSVGVGKKLLLFRTLDVRHSSAGQPRVRSGKQMVAKGKANNTACYGSYRWQNRGFAN